MIRAEGESERPTCRERSASPRPAAPRSCAGRTSRSASPGEGQARIRHTAVGVNYIDTYHRSGLYPLPLPTGLGSEAAGVVEAVGPGVTVVKPGDRVAYAGGGARVVCRGRG